jgi:hypothetical protein
MLDLGPRCRTKNPGTRSPPPRPATASGIALVGSGSVELSPTFALASDCIVLATSAAVVFVLRSRWRPYPLVRRHLGLFFLVLTTYTVQGLIGVLADRSLYHTVLGDSAFLTVLCFFAAPLLGPALRLCGTWSALCTTLVFVDPSHYLAYFTAGNMGALFASLGSLRTRTAAFVLEPASRPATSSAGGSNRDRASRSGSKQS